jgi:hypothetical protein
MSLNPRIPQQDMDDPGVLEGDSEKEIIEKIKKFFRVNHRREIPR